MSRSRSLHALALCAATFAAAGPAMAEEGSLPRAIQLIVPFAADGPTHRQGEILARALAEAIGAEIEVVTLPGYGGLRGAREVAESAQDGSRILLHHTGLAAASIHPATRDFDPVARLQPIGVVSDVSMVIATRPDFEAATLAELPALARSHGEGLFYANAGIGGVSHLCGLLLMEALDAQLTTIPYPGTSPALGDLINGQVDLLCDQASHIAPFVATGQVTALAVTAAERLEMVPDLPTTAEAGLPALDFRVWHGLWAPIGTPEEVVSELARALAEVVAVPQFAQDLAEIAATPAPAHEATPEALAARMARELALWEGAIARAGDYAN